jgi:hypothetical protein
MAADRVIDIKSLPFGCITLATRVIIARFPRRYAEMITRVSSDLAIRVLAARNAGVGRPPSACSSRTHRQVPPG